MRKFLCFIGLHAWVYSWDGMRRMCTHCKRREHLKHEEVTPLGGEIVWHRED